ncbi:hypothetical protein BP5796_10552 [Coleophoma crateriformis]|uniref:Uncharacterized protein n=1 Tax=Coleophoma crateriformis TaxID=565419 RepID=A0A3D8QQX6_9HELO|nr:hypothetical protein BP5796_10552 [Coleophoma crateriformis]
MAAVSQKKLNIAIIGAGLIGPRHAKAVASCAQANLHSLVEPSPKGPDIAASLNTTHYSSIDELILSRPPPDAAIVCTPNSTHVKLSKQLIAAGIHVLVEKPISTTIAEGRELIQAAADAQIQLLVGHHRRFNPYLLAAKGALEQNRIGQVIAVQGIWASQKPRDYFDGLGEWRRNGDSGGPILINLIHEIDLLQYMLGPISYVAAIPTPNQRGFAAEEGAAIMLRFGSGAVGTFLLSDNVVAPWSFEAGTGENPMIPQVRADAGAGGFYRVMGTKGSLSVADMTIWKYAGEEGDWTKELVKEELEVQTEKIPFDLQVQHLVDVVLGGMKPSCSGEDALQAMVVCDAIKRAMVSGTGIEIP